MLVDIANSVLAKLCKGEARNYISQIVFDAKRSDNENIIFLAPNQLIANFIRTKYLALLSNTFELEAGIKPQINITVQAQSKAKSNQKSVDMAQLKAQSSLLNVSFTFDSFIVGDSNQYAFTVAKSVAAEPGKSYNPLFIYGSTGLGKTHLLHSIGNATLARSLNVIYVTAEQFYNDFIVNVENRSMPKFKEKYRKCDILLIDDVQFLATRTPKVQEEFFHTFNDLRNKNAQIALTSDKPPKLLKGFEERLVSRFESGLVADITPPELDTKIRIIKAKCKIDGVVLNDEIINYIATNMGDNIREIEGALLSINAYARLMSQTITLEFAKNIIKDQIKSKKDTVSLEEIINIVAKEQNIKVSEIKSKNKTKKIVEARRICIYLAKNFTPNSMPQLAQHFGLKDHSAVSHNIKKINEIMESNEEFKTQIEEIKNKILQEK